MSIKMLFQNVQLRQVLVTVSNTQKVNLSIMYFYILQFAAQCKKNYTLKNAKMNKSRVEKNGIVKNFELPKWLILFNNTIKQFQTFPGSLANNEDL